jgi:hypothetical protein
MKLGDTISVFATPIARALGMDCIDPITNELRPESPCFKAKQALNEGRYWDAFNDRCFSKNGKHKEINMDAADEVPFQIVVITNAKSVENALERFRTEGVTKSVNPIPQPPKPAQQQIAGSRIPGSTPQATITPTTTTTQPT